MKYNFSIEIIHQYIHNTKQTSKYKFLINFW